jgi:hypothetical protein
MKGEKDHGRYSNLDHQGYLEQRRRDRRKPTNIGIPGRDYGREKRAMRKRKRSSR